jgi:hypothetical protein
MLQQHGHPHDDRDEYQREHEPTERNMGFSDGLSEHPLGMTPGRADERDGNQST